MKSANQMPCEKFFFEVIVSGSIQKMQEKQLSFGETLEVGTGRFNKTNNFRFFIAN